MALHVHTLQPMVQCELLLAIHSFHLTEIVKLITEYWWHDSPKIKNKCLFRRCKWIFFASGICIFICYKLDECQYYLRNWSEIAFLCIMGKFCCKIYQFGNRGKKLQLFHFESIFCLLPVHTTFTFNSSLLSFRVHRESLEGCFDS